MEQALRDLTLDPSQLACVKIPPSARQVVVAGPGSGKTEVVSSLIERLVTEEDVDPVDGLLLISFSNAAVHAVDARLRSRLETPVRAQTMDSLAGAILMDLGAAEGEAFDFDARINMAGRLLRDEAWDRLDDVEHLLVDEVQDVVGVRADFLLTLIDALPEECGFTLLGDPAQGIYDFQIRPTAGGRQPLSVTTSQELFRSVSALSGVTTRELDGQYRALTRDARRAALLRSSVLSDSEPLLLEDFQAELIPTGSVQEAATLASGWHGTTAFLTATNGQALLVAGALREAGHAVGVARSAQQRVVASWLGRILGDFRASTISSDEFQDLVKQRCPDLDPAELWRGLRALVGGRGTQVDLLLVAQRLRSRRPLLPVFIDQVGGGLVVSTIHRAKGLEFDNVVLVDFPSRPAPAEPEHDYWRSRFVAVTRARQLITRAEGPPNSHLRKTATRGEHPGRWYLGGHKPWMTLGFEVTVGDIDATEPPSDDPLTAQSHLSEVAKPGDRLRFELDPMRSSLSVPVYTVLHGSVPVGRTSKDFGEQLVSRIGDLSGKARGWPRLGAARLESVATQIGEPQQGPVGRHGVWLAPVVTGLVIIDWSRGAQ